MSEPFYTQEEREKVRVTYHDKFFFRGSVDLLSDKVEVFTPEKYTEAELATAIASYIGQFMIWDWKRLNGFQGLDCIKWDIKKGRPDGH